MKFERGLWRVVFDLVGLFPGVFVVVVALPFAEVFISTVPPFVDTEVEYEFENVVASLVHVDVRGVGEFSLVFGVVVVGFEHIGGENGVSSLAAWEIEGAVAMVIDGGDLIGSSPDVSEFLCQALLVSPCLVHNKISNVECYLRIAPSL